MPTWISIAAVIAIVVIGLIVVVQMIAITALLFVVKNLAEEIRERIDPLISKTNSLLLTANEIAQSVQGKTEHIAEKTAHTTDVLTDRVEKLSGLLQILIASPIIHGAAFMEGISRGFSVWHGLRKRRKHRPDADEGVDETVFMDTTPEEPFGEEAPENQAT